MKKIMDVTELDDLINTLQKSGENERVEAKQTTRAVGRSLLSTISAFSNEPPAWAVDILS